MAEDSDRQIDADEANRLAQELNRQVYHDIPEYTPETQEAPGRQEGNQPPSYVLRDPPDRELEERVFPPQVDAPASIGGGPDAIESLQEEERR